MWTILSQAEFTLRGWLGVENQISIYRPEYHLKPKEFCLQEFHIINKQYI